MNGNEEFVQEFLEECQENLDQLDQDLVALETDPRNPERLASIFRTIHTIKGTSGFFGFSKLGGIAHAGENLLGRLRDGHLLLNRRITTALLQMVDAVREILGNIEKVAVEGDGDYRELNAELACLVESPSSEDAGPPAVMATDPPQHPAKDDPASAKPAEPSPGASSPDREPDALPSPDEATHSPIATSASGSTSLVPTAQPPPDGVVAASKPLKSDVATSVTAEGSIRVDVHLLNKLMNLAGELVLSRNRLRQFATTQVDPQIASAVRQLNLVTSELQEGVMKTRMQPIKNIWSKFPRVVRDLAIACGKEVRLEMLGEDTELDRSLLEAIKDPLTHLVRNSVDHGIEVPDERRSCGKPATGHLLLRAYHEGGQVNIEIQDDGAGIDPQRIKQKAIERGLISVEQEAMNDRQLLQLIFRAGFSTAETVTDVSGRGVGMDVVKTNIESIGGTIDLRSQSGQGTTLKIVIPLTLAIIPVLLVTSGGQQFAIPQTSLLEMVSFDSNSDGPSIELIHNAPVYRLRGQLLPLVDLNSVLQLDSSSQLGVMRNGDAGEGDVEHRCAENKQAGTINIVVLQAEDQPFGLVVDQVGNTEEIVVKPLNRVLTAIPVFSGATIMGDGSVALILDVLGLARHGGMSIESMKQALVEAASEEQDEQPKGHWLVLCQVAHDRQLAIPLAHVARLEVIPLGQVERSAGREVVQYRNRIMPLVHLADLFDQTQQDHGGSETLPTVVYTDGRRSLGLVVDRILDVIQFDGPIQRTGRLAGMVGTTVINDRVTDVFDLAGTIRRNPGIGQVKSEANSH